MGNHEISFQLKSNLGELDTLCQELERFGEVAGLSQKCIFELNLALDELFTNIISYAHGEGCLEKVNIRIKNEGDTLVICVEDQGIPFNPVDVAKPDFKCTLNERKIGGLGIHLIKSVMDDIAYQRSGNKNILTLKKAI